MLSNLIYQGDALPVLQSLPDAFVQCCITSPPYYGLRDYQVEGQIGLEQSPFDYIDKLVQVFREVRRVLRNDGIFWLNIGDSYANTNYEGNKVFGNVDFNKNRPSREQTKTPKHTIPQGLKPKDLMMIPARLAIALQDDGWYLRSDIIWHKPNAMPESVTDRPTSAHEHVFLLAKSERYYYDQEAMKEPSVSNHDSGNGFVRHARLSFLNADGTARGNVEQWKIAPLRNKRNVWTIAIQPYASAHFATMPPKLVEPCVLAGSARGDIILDPFCGAGTVPLVALQNNRRYLGIELNAEYIKLIEKRIETIQPTLWSA